MPLITIADVGPSPASFGSSNVNHSSSGRILSLAIGTDGVRMYAGTFAGVWRSDDAGRNWHQMIRPQPDASAPDAPGALYAPTVLDLAVSPGDVNIVLAAGSDGRFATSRDGLYRSADGGASWQLVLKASIGEIAFAPDDPSLVYAAVGNGVAVSHNAGQTWNVVKVGQLGSSALHVAVAPREPSGIRRVYAAGGNEIFYSTDGGTTWRFDPGTSRITSTRQTVSDFQVACAIAAGQPPSPLPSFAGGTAAAVGSGAHIIAVEPGNPSRIYLAARGAANGPSYYNNGNVPPDGTPCNTNCKRLAGEASLWLGDFGQFETLHQAKWGQLGGPPVYTGVTTPSGNTFVVAKRSKAGFLLFFSDQSHVHVSSGTPAGSHTWHRLDGKDASEVQQAGDHSNFLFVHADPHALVTTSDFDITLKAPTGVGFPYNQNNVLDKFLGGTIWMANDGGVYRSEDGGRNWKLSVGLNTVDAVNLAGLFGLGSAPALYMGCGDNDDFFSRDGGKTWKDPISSCGDCDAWFADVAQPRRVLEFLPRDDRMFVINSPLLPAYPDATSLTGIRAIPRPRSSNISSGFVIRGFRPVIQTLPNEAPLADGDYVFIGTKADGTRVVLRTLSISSITAQAHWDDPNKAQQIGPPVPGQADLVQVGGGHQAPVFFVGDASGRVFKLDAAKSVWNAIVPGGPAGRKSFFATRFFVDPYNPSLIYLVDSTEIRVSLDGGASWLPDPALRKAVTAGGLISISSTVIQDILFVRNEPFTRFVFGDAGVFCTTNGFEWFPLLNTIAFPGRAETGFFDPVSDPANRSLYVSLSGRSIVRLSPVPPPEINPPSVIDLLEFAAIVEA